MKIRLLGWLAGVAAVAAAASPGCSQPKPECTVGNAALYPFAAKFFLEEGDADSPCAQVAGATVGMQVYNPDAGGYPDRNTKLVAIQVDRAAWTGENETIAESADRKTYSLGAFESNEPDDSNFCRVSTLSPAEVLIVPSPPDGEGGGGGGDGGAGGGEGGAGDGGDGGEPAEGRSLRYEWSNMEVYVTAANLGNTFQADLTYTEGTCTAKYRVVGLWPLVHCGLATEEPVLDPTTGEQLVDSATGEPVFRVVETPQDRLCDNIPDPEPPYYIPYASGIAEDLKVKCDPEMLVCVLDSDRIPAFK